MTHYFWFRTRDRDVTSNLVAETFTVALETVKCFDPTRGEPRQWLYGIAKNQLKTYWRKQRVATKARQRLAIQTPPTSLAGWDEIESVENQIDAAQMTEMLDRLPTRNREAVRLRIMEQLDYPAIAQRLGCSPKSAKDAVFRGLKRLRTLIDKQATTRNER